MAKMLYEGKAKKVFETENPNEVIIYYKDDATAMNGLKKGTIADKGIMNNTITSFFFGQAAGGDVTGNYFHGDDTDFFTQRFTIVELFDLMMGDAVFGKQV